MRISAIAYSKCCIYLHKRLGNGTSEQNVTNLSKKFYKFEHRGKTGKTQ